MPKGIGYGSKAKATPKVRPGHASKRTGGQNAARKVAKIAGRPGRGKRGMA